MKTKNFQGMIATKLPTFAKGPLNSLGSNKLNILIQSEDWKAVQLKCEHSPKSARVWSTIYGFYDGEYDSRMLPLHVMCSLHAPESAVESVIVAYPKALQATESVYDRIPLHTACMNNASLGVIRVLLSNYKNGAQVQDSDGRTALHYALSNSAPLEVIKMLLDAFPKGVKVTDDNGWLPIHVACIRGASTDVVRLLVRDYPETACCRTAKKTSPTMIVKSCGYQNELEVLDVLDLAMRLWEKVSWQKYRSMQALSA